MVYYSTKRRHLFWLLLIVCPGLFLSDCERLNISKIVKIETQPISERQETSAVMHGMVYDCGENPIIEYGHCWAIHENPDTADEHISLGSLDSARSFFTPASLLLPGTTYYYRAYCDDGVAVTYGNQRHFMTLPAGINAIFEELPAGTALLIDGAEDVIWSEVPAVAIERNFMNEKPTMKAYWKGMWDYNYIYVMVNVEDDDHYPAWEANNTTEPWNWDRADLFFDVNDVLKDGLGPQEISTGHFQTAPGFEENGYGIEHLEACNNLNCVSSYYAYQLYGENYRYEWKIPLINFVNKNSEKLDIANLKTIVIGYDVTIADQDEGVTTLYQRKVWQSDGKYDGKTCWDCMDHAGKVMFIEKK
jgi:hypothetical protein